MRELARGAGDEVGRRLTERLAAAGDGVGGEADRLRIARQLLQAWLLAHREDCVREGRPRLGSADEEALAQAVLDRLFGLAGLQRYLDDVSVDNIHINGCDAVFVDYSGRKVRVPPVADSDEELIDLLRRIAAREGLSEREFSPSSPILDVTLRDGSRLNAVMSVSDRPAVTIRRHRLLDATPEELVGVHGLMAAEVCDLLVAAIRAKQSIVVSGGMGCGKSTLVRSLGAVFPPSWRVVTLEDPRELWWDRQTELHPDCVALEARHPNLQGEGGISIRDLFTQALRMDADVVVVGEVRSDEVTPMLNAMSAGSAGGSLCTVHARSALDTFTRLQVLLAQAPERLGAEAAAALIGSAVDLVVHIETDVDRRTGERRRWVDSVREVRGADRGMVVSNEVLRVDEAGRVLAPAALSDELRRRLARAGAELRVVPSEWPA